MKAFLVACSVAAFAALSLPATADEPAAATAPAPAAKFSTSDTTIGDLLDTPQARAVLDKYIPGFTSNEQIDAARGMTLRGIQQFAPETITDEVLAKIDSDLAKLPPK